MKMNKTVALVLALVLVIGVAVGGTLAWLTANSETVTNTFTTSDIGVTLTETKTDFKMIPGWTIDKDPVVTVKADSEDCFVFLKVDESENLDAYIAYAIDGVGQPNGNWKQLVDKEGKEVEGVYYCVAQNITADRSIKVLGGGTYKDDKLGEFAWAPQQVLVKPSVTKDMMTAVADNKPTLTFTAYAAQLWKSNATDDVYVENHPAAFKPYEAWDLVKPNP